MCSLKHYLNAILTELQLIRRTMPTKADLDAAIAANQSAETASLAQINQSLTDLLAKSQSAPTEDFTAEIASLQAQTAQLVAAGTAAAGDDPGVQQAPNQGTTPAPTSGDTPTA